MLPRLLRAHRQGGRAGDQHHQLQGALRRARGHALLGKIFYAAKESWTISSTNWEGVNWGLFSGDDESMKEQVGRVYENAKRLKAEVLLLPE